MAWKLNCDCKNIGDLSINNQSDFQRGINFFHHECIESKFQELIPQQPYYTWRQGSATKKWFATKWYKCMICGCLWEFQYPDFPAKGFIRKFPDGVYHERGF